MAGEGRKLPGAGKHGCGRQRWWKVAAAAAVFLPSLLSPLFLFSAPFPLFFPVILSFSPLCLRGCQRGQVTCCGGGEEARWQLWLFFFFGIFFFLCHFPSGAELGLFIRGGQN